jgi:hypothetical protein
MINQLLPSEKGRPGTGRSPSLSQIQTGLGSGETRLPAELQRLRLKLSPLNTVHAPLAEQLKMKVSSKSPRGPDPDVVTYSYKRQENVQDHEYYVRSGSDWQNMFSESLNNAGGATLNHQPSADSLGARSKRRDATTLVLNGCADDMVALWNSKHVQEVLGTHRLRLMNSPGL